MCPVERNVSRKPHIEMVSLQYGYAGACASGTPAQTAYRNNRRRAASLAPAAVVAAVAVVAAAAVVAAVLGWCSFDIAPLFHSPSVQLVTVPAVAAAPLDTWCNLRCCTVPLLRAVSSMVDTAAEKMQAFLDQSRM